MSKSEQISRFYEFGPFRIDPYERVLLRDGQPVTLAPKLFDTLLVLVERSGHIVEKAELMKKVWPDTFVEESNLSSSVSLLRKTLGTDTNGNQYIETVARRGYRFVQAVEVTDKSSELIFAKRTRLHVVTREEEEDSEQRVITNHHQSGTAAQDSWGTPQVAGINSTAEPSVGSGRWNKRVATLLSIAALVLVAAAFLGIKYIRREKTASRPAGHFLQIRMERHTTSGEALSAAISPDGKYLMNAMSRDGQWSLWLKHIPTGSNQQIVAPSLTGLSGLAFSPDGNYVYFVRSGIPAEGQTLYRMPVLGGSEKRLVRDIDTPITFSPDGSRIAFVRGAPSRKERLLIVAKADSTNEQTVATHKLEDRFLVGPGWSPNGETIVFASRGAGTDDSNSDLVEVRLKDGTERQITWQKWSSITAICWLRDGNGLVIIAANREPGSNSQIWYVSYPSGEVRRITNDLNDYMNLSLTADSSSFTTVQFERTSNIWFVPDRENNLAKQITHTNHDWGGAWTPDGRIVFVSGDNHHQGLWIMNRDGTNKKQLLEPLPVDATWGARPVVSADGRYIVFVLREGGKSHIWRMDIDGSIRKQLTFGGGEVRPICSPDNRWVVYTSLDTLPPTIWKVPIEGGNPVQVTNSQSMLLAISPKDGQIAYAYDEQRESSLSRRVAVIPLAGGPPTKVFDFPFPSGQAISFAPDGQSLTYIGTPRTNIWSQPLNGGPPKQLTQFKSGRILSFAWSRDGRDLILTRGTRVGDVVLIRDQR